MNYEGARAPGTSIQPYQKEAVYVIDGKTGQLAKVTDEIFKPNGLCFSPDYKKLYVADTGASHYDEAPKNIKVWDIDGRTVKNGREFASMKLTMADGSEKAGFADGIRCDTEGNIWASAGWVGAGYDGVHIFSGQDGQRIGQILLPEICSNVCFGGTKRNRLFMTASTSIYAVYVETQGAHITCGRAFADRVVAGVPARLDSDYFNSRAETPAPRRQLHLELSDTIASSQPWVERHQSTRGA
jgi:gluconolactonase